MLGLAACGRTISEGTPLETDGAVSSGEATEGGSSAATGADTTASGGEDESTTDPQPAACGNGMVETGEECDPGPDGIGPALECLPGCVLNVCGDGMPGPSEACDDADIDDDDGCKADCTPTLVSVLAPGGSHTCAALDTGSVRCWGNGSAGRTGLGQGVTIGDDEPASAAAVVTLGAAVDQIVAGASHTCVRYVDAAVRCFGRSLEGQLGYGVPGDIGDDEAPNEAPFVLLGGTVSMLSSSAGAFHNCALLEQGGVRCWGLADNGRLGVPGLTGAIGDDEELALLPTVDVGGTAVDVAVGAEHSCVRFAGGGVRCWGHNASGQLGQGNTDDVGDNESPASVPTIALGGPVAQIAAGFFHNCVLLEAGFVRCWGRGNNGRLGYGNTVWIGDNEVPSSAGNVDVGGVVVELTAGNAHSCARLDTGAVRCWGWAGMGQLGYGDLEDVGDDEVPAEAGDVPLGAPAVRIAAGGNHTCALLDTGRVRCWGSADHGRLGYGDLETIGDDETPARVGDVPMFPK
ncbi:MAG: hypothetical protein K0V04_01390 [Deltaproteobacteria bacterium]|nr:hypothetical protein [Deltaproteobacteria bacterium]